MRADRFFPEVEIKTKDRFVGPWNVADLLASGSLLSVADWLDRWQASTGPRPLNAIIAQAALELAKISKHTTGKTDWQWIEKKLRANFKDAPAGKSLHALTQNFKRKELGKLRRRMQTDPEHPEPFKLLPDRTQLAPATDAEINAVFTQMLIRNSPAKVRKASKKRLRCRAQENLARGFRIKAIERAKLIKNVP